MSARLIVTADDLGMSDCVNAGIVKTIDDGIVTSASLMVRRPAAPAAVELLCSRPHVSLGLHLDLGEWRPEGGEWVRHDEVVDVEDAQAVEAEVRRQLERFVELVGAPPTHLDSHQHVHRQEPVRSVLRGLAGDLGVVLREEDGLVRYCGDFYGQWGMGHPLPEAISPAGMCRLLEELPDGVTELGCHPGLDPDLDSPYAAERVVEVATLCHPEVRETMVRRGIELVTFAALRGPW